MNLEKEFGAGYTSGFQHDSNDPLCRDNIRKMESGVNAEEPAVKSYWLGYRAAIRDQMTLNREVRDKAETWYRSLSINEQKAHCAKHKAVVVGGWPLPSWLVEMWQEATGTATI